jgi:hypothetical protein
MALTKSDFRNLRENDFRNEEPQREISVDDARQASALGHVRYVLGISMALVIVLFAIIYFSYARTW